MANEGWYGRTILVSNMSWDSSVSIVSGYKSDDQGQGFLPLVMVVLKNPYLGAFGKLQELTIGFIVSVCPSTWNSLAPTGQILMNFYI